MRNVLAWVVALGVLTLAGGSRSSLDAAAPPVAAQGLKTINPPQGGQIVYGQVVGETTEAGAMGSILRSLHNRLGDRPRVGRLFQAKGSQSVAAFFSVNRKDQNIQVAGLLIVAKATTDHVEAALLTDEASRFPKTLGPMLKTLFGVWQPLAAAKVGASGPGAPAAPLHQVILSDRSASVGLPDGWRLVPKMSMGGSLVALGPKEESAELGIAFLSADTNNPHVQQLMNTLRAGGLRNTVYANADYYPYGADMAQTWVHMMQVVRKKAGLPAATYNFTSVTPVVNTAQERCVHISGTADLGDGKLRGLNCFYCTTPPSPRTGDWGSTAYSTMAPVAVFDQERATLNAILQSFRIDMNVVSREAAAIAAPVIAQIHAIGDAATARINAAHQMEDIHNSSVYQHWDSIDKRSQEFENYQLGYSVISNVEHTAHATLENEDADALVKQNPDRFEYVSAPDYWKGVDY